MAWEKKSIKRDKTYPWEFLYQKNIFYDLSDYGDEEFEHKPDVLHFPFLKQEYYIKYDIISHHRGNIIPNTTP